MPVGFRGVVLTAPGIATYIDDTQSIGAVSAPGTSVAIVGIAERGQPNTAIAFTDAATAQAVYGAGGTATPLVDGIVRALDAGATTVYGVRVGAAKPFVANLTNSTTTAIAVTTKEYGRFCKAWSLVVEASTATITVNGSSVGRKVTLNLHDNRSYAIDNISKSLIDIVVTSTTSTGTATVAADKITLTSTVSGVSSTDFLFSSYPTLASIISAINATGNWKASLKTGADGTWASNTIDVVTSGTVPVSTGTPYVLTGNVRALVDVLNGPVFSPFISAVYSTNVPSITVATYPFKYYTTGTTEGVLADYDPTPTSTDWANAFSQVQNLPVYFVVPMTDNASYHAAAKAHAEAMSLPTGRSERIAIVGGASGETSSAVIARASALNSKRAVLVWPGIKDYDSTGTLVILPPYYLAAQIAGKMASQGDPAEPLTNKVIGLSGLESSIPVSTIDDLVNGGVLAIRNDLNRGFVVVQSLTTWTGDLRFARREISTIRAADEVMSSIRSAVSPYVGAKSTVGLVGTIKNVVQNTLSLCESRGLIVANPGSPTQQAAFSGITIRVINDAYYIDFSCSPAKPANYMLITAYVS